MSVYECGDILEMEEGETLYCVKDQDHDGDHYGKPAGDRFPDALWEHDDPGRRANRDSPPPSG